MEGGCETEIFVEGGFLGGAFGRGGSGRTGEFGGFQEFFHLCLDMGRRGAGQKCATKLNRHFSSSWRCLFVVEGSQQKTAMCWSVVQRL